MAKSEECKAAQAKLLRFKKPALMDMDYGLMIETLQEIQDDCIEIHDMVADDVKLLAALDDNEEEAFEFKLAFADLEGDCGKLIDAIHEHSYYVSDEDAEQEYNDCTVYLVGDIFDLVGFDDYERDYFKLTDHLRDYAAEESGKRLMRMTKKDMLNTIGYNMRLFLGYFELKQRYDHLKATISIVKGSNQSLIDLLREIEAAYEKANEISDGFKYTWYKPVRDFNALLQKIPDRFWVE